MTQEQLEYLRTALKDLRELEREAEQSETVPLLADKLALIRHEVALALGVDPLEN